MINVLDEILIKRDIYLSDYLKDTDIWMIKCFDKVFIILIKSWGIRKVIGNYICNKSE